MVLMIFSTGYGSGIFKEVLVFCKKRTVFGNAVLWLLRLPSPDCSFNDCGGDVAEWKAIFTVCVEMAIARKNVKH